MSVIAVTATGSRLEPLMLCMRMMARQTRKPDKWIILSDSPPYPKNIVLPGMVVDTYQTQKVWKPGDPHSLASNIRILMELVTPEDKVFFIEDDDFYHPDYLAVMMKEWDITPQAEVLGVTDARYYNVATRRYREMGNRTHASLCSTAITGRAYFRMKEIAESGQEFLDLPLWETPKLLKKLIFNCQHLCVGIKGLPGRAGIGTGHRPEFGIPDPTGAVLHKWIGDAANVYVGEEAT